MDHEDTKNPKSLELQSLSPYWDYLMHMKANPVSPAEQIVRDGRIIQTANSMLEQNPNFSPLFGVLVLASAIGSCESPDGREVFKPALMAMIERTAPSGKKSNMTMHLGGLMGRDTSMNRSPEGRQAMAETFAYQIYDIPGHVMARSLQPDEYLPAVALMAFAGFSMPMESGMLTAARNHLEPLLPIAQEFQAEAD